MSARPDPKALADRLEEMAEQIDDRVCEMSGEPPADYLRARAAEAAALRQAASLPPPPSHEGKR